MQIKRRRRKPLLITAAVLGVVVVGFITWLVIGLINQKAELALTQTYELPELISLKDQFEVSAGSYAVAVDGEVANHSELTTQPTASTAKMILGLAVMQAKPFEKGTPGETITITENDYNKYLWYLNNNGTNIAVAVGEEISEYDALVAVFLASANNMADTLAEWAFGSLDEYRTYASKMLSDWGLNDTTIGIDASGFDASTTSTAADLAQIGAKVLENSVLAEIVGTKEYNLPVAGTIENSNRLLGVSNIAGIKTGFIGDASGYCLATGYFTDDHIITAMVMGEPSRDLSFSDSLTMVETAQSLLTEQVFVKAGVLVGYYDSWWTGKVAIHADQDLIGIGWAEAEPKAELTMDGQTGTLKITVGEQNYTVSVSADAYTAEPSFGDRLGHLFGWQNTNGLPEEAKTEEPQTEEPQEEEPAAENVEPFTNAPSNNCTIKFGALMLINPNFTVEDEFIAARRGELISLSANYGINEHNTSNGDNLLDAEAAEKINEMVKAYEADNPGHTLETLSCFRAVGTNCGRLCAATGTSDHHTGLTCDLVDPVYGVSLDTSTYDSHPDWQWLKANSYKYGFIDRFPEAWAGGSMSEPLNVDANGSTGLFETWHYRYVGVGPATEIATGKYNNGQYDSLEHYLKSRGMVTDLKNGTCE